MDMDASFASSIEAKTIQAPHRREPRIGVTAGAKVLPVSAFAPPEYPYTRSFSNPKPVLSSLSRHEVNDIAQAAVGPRRCPSKPEVTGSNPVGPTGARPAQFSVLSDRPRPMLSLLSVFDDGSLPPTPWYPSESDLRS
jgi:hypothetical protein